MADTQPAPSAQPANAQSVLPVGGKDTDFYRAALATSWKNDMEMYVAACKRLNFSSIARPPNPAPLRDEKKQIEGVLNNALIRSKLSPAEIKDFKRRLHQVKVRLFEMSEVRKDAAKVVAKAKKQAMAWKFRGVQLSRLKGTASRAKELCEMRGIELSEWFPEIAAFENLDPDEEAEAIEEVENTADDAAEEADAPEEDDDEIEA